MPRIGISYLEVATVADSLLAKGIANDRSLAVMKSRIEPT